MAALCGVLLSRLILQSGAALSFLPRRVSPIAPADAVSQQKPHEVASGTLLLVDALTRALDLTESGAAKLVSEGHGAQDGVGQIAATSAAIPEKGDVAFGGLKQILHQLHSLRLLAKKVRGHHSSDIESLQADVARQQAQLAVAEERAESLRRENQQLQMALQQELKRSQSCAEIQATSPSCAAARRKDGESIRVLNHTVFSLHVALNQSIKSCKLRAAEQEAQHSKLFAAFEAAQKTATDLQTNATEVATERLALQRVNQSLQQQMVSAKLKDKDVQNKFSLLKQEEEDAEEDRDDLQESLWEARAANGNLKKDAEAHLQTIAQLQRDLDASSKDKERLLDSIRALMHHDHQQLHPSSQKLSAKESTGSARTFDEIAWMGRTDKIDGYLTKVSTVLPRPDPASAESKHGKVLTNKAVVRSSVALDPSFKGEAARHGQLQQLA